MSLSSADINNEIGLYKSTTSIEKHYMKRNQGHVWLQRFTNMKPFQVQNL